MRGFEARGWLNLRDEVVAGRSQTAEPYARWGGWLSRAIREKKCSYFFSYVSKDAKILDVGCADGWVGRWAREHGWTDLTGLDVVPPADVVGEIERWDELGLGPHSFDVVVAFEVVEHGDFAGHLHELVKPGGLLLVTTPRPQWDWLCQVLEWMRILQKRTGPHSHLVDMPDYPGFQVVAYTVRGLVSQWAVLRAE
jgi:2-polyprenyl-3-methyl-5-hydroxy-6-metoxy-1,4-benzoquinol methylase